MKYQQMKSKRIWYCRRKQFNAISEMASNSGSINGSSNDRRIMSDEEYYKRYGHRRGERKNSSNVENFLMEGE